jgi:hypothetical protein
VLRPIDLAVAGYLLASLASLVGTSNHLQSGLEVVKELYLGAVYLAFSLIASHRGHAVHVARWLSASGTMVAALGLLAFVSYQWFGIVILDMGQRIVVPTFGDVFRLKGMLHSPEFLGEYLTFILPLLVGVAMQADRRPGTVWRWLSLSIVVAAAILTVSRSIAGAVVAGLLSTWRVWSVGWKRVIRWGWVALAVAAVIGANVASVVAIRDVTFHHGRDPSIGPPPYVHASHQEHLGARTATASVTYDLMGYYLLKRVAWEGFQHRPIIGIGVGGFNDEAERAYQAGKLDATFRRLDPHSTWCGRLVEAGLLGVLTLLVLWGGFIRRGVRLARPARHTDWVPGMVLAGLVGLLVNSPNVDIMHFRFLWVGFALLRAAG